MIADLIRHGTTGLGGFRGRLDDPLDATGWLQMRNAAATTDEAWQIVICSPLRRCAEFASEIAAKRGLPLETDARLAELDFGDWEGASAEELMRTEAGAEALRRFWDDPWRHPPPQGEPLTAFEERVRTAWQDLAARHAGKSVLLVTHGGVIRLLLCLARGLPRRELLNLDVPHASLYRIAAAEIFTEIVTKPKLTAP